MLLCWFTKPGQIVIYYATLRTLSRLVHLRIQTRESYAVADPPPAGKQEAGRRAHVLICKSLMKYVTPSYTALHATGKVHIRSMLHRKLTIARHWQIGKLTRSLRLEPV